jgi:hypothetical protein
VTRTRATASTPAALGVTYDTGALIAADRRDSVMWTRHLTLLRHGTVPTVPAVVVAQAWRSPRQVALTRLIKGCYQEEFTAATARAVGARAARTRHGDVVDLAVAEGAVHRGDVVFTSDPADLSVAGVPAARILQV